jgi:hypothetical protein
VGCHSRRGRQTVGGGRHRSVFERVFLAPKSKSLPKSSGRLPPKPKSLQWRIKEPSAAHLTSISLNTCLLPRNLHHALILHLLRPRRLEWPTFRRTLGLTFLLASCFALAREWSTFTSLGCSWVSQLIRPLRMLPSLTSSPEFPRMTSIRWLTLCVCTC